jgi:hypothetical protein
VPAKHRLPVRALQQLRGGLDLDVEQHRQLTERAG